jgi:hypothetical protein
MSDSSATTVTGWLFPLNLGPQVIEFTKTAIEELNSRKESQEMKSDNTTPLFILAHASQQMPIRLTSNMPNL